MQGRREKHTILALNCISLVIINSSNNVNEQNVGASFSSGIVADPKICNSKVTHNLPEYAQTSLVL